MNVKDIDGNIYKITMVAGALPEGYAEVIIPEELQSEELRFLEVVEVPEVQAVEAVEEVLAVEAVEEVLEERDNEDNIIVEYVAPVEAVEYVAPVEAVEYVPAH